MALIPSTKGKKRALQEPRADYSSASQSPAPPELPPVKKPKRAETKSCPVCNELIPIRLLARHTELEFERVEEIIKSVGSTDVLAGCLEEGAGSRNRRSAVKARESLSAMNPRTDATGSLDVTGKTIQAIRRHRKRRHAKLRDMTREDEDGGSGSACANGRDGITCPVCLQIVRGDQDVMEAHVDACLVHETTRLREEAERNQVDEWDETGAGARLEGVNLRGTGFDLRDRNALDVEDEVDVDGDDEAVFGDAQFTEGDIVGNPQVDENEDEEVHIDGDSDDEAARERKTLRDLVAEGKVVRRRSPDEGMESVKAKMEEVMGVGETDKMDLAVSVAREQGDSSALIMALQDKIKQLESLRVSSSTSLLCRICLDPYTEATVSTGCWHTCCRECWLRCLGSTKLCPICKRITAATELRRVYL